MPSVCNFVQKVEDWTEFQVACLRGDVQKVSRLANDQHVDLNAGRSKMKTTPFFLACQEGRDSVVSFCLENKRVDVSAKDSAGRTPLHIACLMGHATVVALLVLDKRTNLNARDNKGRTPLLLASKKGNPDVLRILAECRQVDVNMCDNFGSTPLFEACKHGNFSAVEILLRHPRFNHANTATSQGQTPLFVACTYNRTRIIRRLLEDGRSRLDCTTLLGSNPFFAACIGRRVDVMRMMVASGKKIDLSSTIKVGRTQPINNLTVLNVAALHDMKDAQGLIEGYSQNRKATVQKTQEEIGWMTNSSHTFGLITLISEEMLAIKEAEKNSRAARFFSMASKLHFDVQMVLSVRADGKPHDSIPLHERLMAFGQLSLVYGGSGSRSPEKQAKTKKFNREVACKDL